jgi:hypothetical protein
LFVADEMKPRGPSLGAWQIVRASSYAHQPPYTKLMMDSLFAADEMKPRRPSLCA